MDFTCAADAVSLPVELTDGIIDYLVDDRLSLRATSLVCRAWCPRSRRHLFHTVHVKAVRKSFRSFLAFLNHNDERPGCSPPIAHLIRCLIERIRVHSVSHEVLKEDAGKRNAHLSRGHSLRI